MCTGSRSTAGCAAGRWCRARGPSRGGGACSCGDSACKQPGAHPLAAGAEVPGRCGPRAGRRGVGPGAGRVGAAARRAVLRRDRGGGGARAAGDGADGADGAAPGPGAADAVGAGAVLRRARAPRPNCRICSTGWAGTTRGSTCAAWGPATMSPLPRRTSPGSARSAGCAEPPLDAAAQPPEARLLLGTLAYVCHRHGAELVARH